MFLSRGALAAGQCFGDKPPTTVVYEQSLAM
jgi:hypothetical protein